jgi:hypothetical protein
MVLTRKILPKVSLAVYFLGEEDHTIKRVQELKFQSTLVSSKSSQMIKALSNYIQKVETLKKFQRIPLQIRKRKMLLEITKRLKVTDIQVINIRFIITTNIRMDLNIIEDIMGKSHQFQIMMLI